MFYPKADCCPFNDSDNLETQTINQQARQSDNMCETEKPENVFTQKELMKKIQEVDFAIIDLNLFLDTHPDCSEALSLFNELSLASEKLKSEYQKNFGPLYASKSPDTVPFKWVESCYKWPWEK